MSESEDHESNYDSDDSDADSFATMADMLNQLNLCVSEMYGLAEELEEELQELHPPIQELSLAQFGEAGFLASSPFRYSTFAPRPGIPGLDPTRRYMFQEICKKLRDYLIELDAIQADGSIQLTPTLQTMFGFDVATTETSFLELLERIGHIIQ